MNPYTVIAYITPDGGHYIETVLAANATGAALATREKLELTDNEFEIVAVARGRVEFELVDASRLSLAPYSPIPR
mgnify:FL=1